MSFDAKEKTVEQLFDNSNIYEIPRNQRKYVWNEMNWHEFFSDIKYCIENKNKLSWSHFLGAIVLNKVSDKKFEIIDGQQRLTTIYIVMLSLYSQMKEVLPNSEIGKADKLLGTYIYSMDDNNNPQLIINNSDYDKDLRELIHYVINNENNIKNNYFLKVYQWFKEKFKDFNYQNVQEFYDSLIHVTVVEIISNSSEEIYNIFEVLNARGQKLQQIELLKNHILKYLKPRDKDFIDSAKNNWDKMISNLDRKNPDDFLSAFVKVYINKKAQNKDNIYQLIKEEIDISNLSKLLGDLIEYSDVYLKTINSKDRNYQYFKIKNNKQIIPLLSAIQFLKEKDIISENNRNYAFLNLRNFFFHFNILQKTSNRTDSLIKEAAFKVYHCKTEEYFKVIMTELFLDLDKKLGKWTLTNIREQLKYSKVLKYTNRGESGNKKLINYILEEYANFYQMDLPIDDASLTIEHLIPDFVNNEDTCSIANLTLTDKKINNRQLKDKSIQEKCEILKNSNLSINRGLYIYINDKGFDFEKRLKDMSKVLVNNVFKFDVQIFGLDSADVQKFYSNSSYE